MVYAVILGALGAALNTLSFPFLPEVQLIFGNAAIILAAMSLKPPFSVNDGAPCRYTLVFHLGTPLLALLLLV